MAQDVKSLLRVIESASQGNVEAYASLVLSLEKRFIFFFGFMRLENDNQLFNGFRCPFNPFATSSSSARLEAKR